MDPRQKCIGLAYKIWQKVQTWFLFYLSNLFKKYKYKIKSKTDNYGH